jgi:hypothetical protein
MDDGPEAGSKGHPGRTKAVAAAESDRPTLVFLIKKAVRLALDAVALGTACTLPAAARADGWVHGSRRQVPGLPDLFHHQRRGIGNHGWTRDPRPARAPRARLDARGH